MTHPNGTQNWPAPQGPPQAPSKPERRLSSKTLVIITVVLAIALLATMIISFVVWYTPPMEPLNIPEVDQG